jgi:hypothetical protein
MPNTLRDGLWDLSRIYFIKDIAERDIIERIVGYGSGFDRISRAIWFSFFKESVDDRPRNPESALQILRSRFKEFPFFKVYEFIEFLANTSPGSSISDEFTSSCNMLFERERAAFRFADTILIRISDEAERKEIEDAILQDHSVGVRSHIQRAAQLYSHLPNPDYRNSIKESVSAIESAVSFVTGQKPGGIAKPLRSAIAEFNIHPALRDGFEKLYAYTSDAEGIRHALLDEPSLTQADARYMLISCSAFANYLLAKKAEN